MLLTVFRLVNYFLAGGISLTQVCRTFVSCVPVDVLVAYILVNLLAFLLLGFEMCQLVYQGLNLFSVMILCIDMFIFYFLWYIQLLCRSCNVCFRLFSL